MKCACHLSLSSQVACFLTRRLKCYSLQPHIYMPSRATERGKNEAEDFGPPEVKQNHGIARALGWLWVGTCTDLSSPAVSLCDVWTTLVLCEKNQGNFTYLLCSVVQNQGLKGSVLFLRPLSIAQR